jgi:hypothetical protein
MNTDDTDLNWEMETLSPQITQKGADKDRTYRGARRHGENRAIGRARATDLVDSDECHAVEFNCCRRVGPMKAAEPIPRSLTEALCKIGTAIEVRPLGTACHCVGSMARRQFIRERCIKNLKLFTADYADQKTSTTSLRMDEFLSGMNPNNPDQADWRRNCANSLAA